MPQLRKLHVNLYWHMHQPDYRDYLTGEYVLPWTYLHAIKDYTDMAYHLEQNPLAKASFNFVPVLLDQLEDYVDQFATQNMRDPLLALFLVSDGDRFSTAERQLILNSCFKCNHEKMIAPFPQYDHLYQLFKLTEASGVENLDYLSDQYLLDLLVWYHLAWSGESVRREYPLVVHLMVKSSRFTAADRRDLFDLMGQLISGIIPRYKALQQAGQIEISSTPHFHPILPLLLDFTAAHDSMPEAALPESSGYPGGLPRANAHIASAIESHYRRFGELPRGMWPAEGGVSHAALMLLAEHGMAWAATGEGVLGSSLRKAYGEASLLQRQHYLYKPYRVTDGRSEIMTFFRDDKLSDKIGFEYSKWHGPDAVSDFLHELEHIWHVTDADETPVVSIILDGENAWEYFPYNAYYFLTGMYQALADHETIEMSTFSETVRYCASIAKNEELLDLESFHGANIVMQPLPTICAGSWVYGSFSTWIGSPDKNRGWDLLVDAKKCYDQALLDNRLTADEKIMAERQLGDCEGSDWFWWFGDYNSGASVQSFDRLYRRNLANLYRLLKLPVPEVLDHVISLGGGDPEGGGTMRRGEA